MSTMRRSTAGAGKIPVLTLPSGQVSSLFANRATTVRGDVLRRDDLREFRSAYNSSGGKPIHTAPTRRGFTPGKAASVSREVRAALDRRASAPLDPPSCPAPGTVAVLRRAG